MLAASFLGKLRRCTDEPTARIETWKTICIPRKRLDFNRVEFSHFQMIAKIQARLLE